MPHQEQLPKKKPTKPGPGAGPPTTSDQDVTSNRSSLDALDADVAVSEDSWFDGMFGQSLLDDQDLVSREPSDAVCLDEDPSLLVCEVEPVEPGVCLDPSLDPQARLDQAQTDRESLRNALDSFERIPQANRDLLRTRIAGLEGDDLVREMEMINRALLGPNGDRALMALSEIEQLQQNDPDAAARLDGDVVEMLIDGVGERRTESDRGEEGILGSRRVREAATALMAMDDESYNSTRELLDSAGQDAEGSQLADADRGAEQALILKAIAARSDAMADPTQRVAALTEVDTFANAIRGTEREQLIRTTTGLDIDDVNTSNIAPDNIAAGTDTTVDNDGLYQRFTDSCGPTTAQIIRSEIDPVYALALHDDGINNADPKSTTAREQERVLESVGGGTAVARLGAQARTSMGTTLDTLEVDGSITAAQRTALEDLTNGNALTPAQQATADATLAAVRRENGGHPTDMELQAMRDDAGQAGAGMLLDPALNDINTEAQFTWQSGGTTAADIDLLEERAFQGENIPFRIAGAGNSGHFMSVSDVRRDDDGNRSLLVTDPWTGATRWVTETQFTTGTAFTSVFNLGVSAPTGIHPEDA